MAVAEVVVEEMEVAVEEVQLVAVLVAEEAGEKNPCINRYSLFHCWPCYFSFICLITALVGVVVEEVVVEG